MTDEKQHDEQHDEDAIRGEGFGASIHIPVDRKDIGPHIKWAIISFAISMIILALGAAMSWQNHGPK